MGDMCHIMDVTNIDVCPRSPHGAGNTTCSLEEIPPQTGLEYYLHAIDHTRGVQFVVWILVPVFLLHFVFRANKLDPTTARTQLKMLCTRMKVVAVVCMSYLLGLHGVSDAGGGTQTEQKSDTGQIVHPEESASWTSRLFVNWTTDLVRKGYNQTLQEEDVPDLAQRDRSQTVCPLLDLSWRQEQQACDQLQKLEGLKEKKSDSWLHKLASTISGRCRQKQTTRQPNLLRAMFRTYGVTYIVLQIVKCVFELSYFVHPLLLESLMKHIGHRSSEPAWRGYALVVAMFLVGVGVEVVQMQFQMVNRRLFMHARMALRMVIFKKALRARNESKKDKTTGELVSLIHEDVDKLVYSCDTVYFFLATPIKVCLALWMLYKHLGLGAFVGLAIMLAMIPFNAWVGKKVHGLEEQISKVKDERIKAMNEILNGIKILKLYAWEKSFIGKVTEIRHRELLVYTWITFSHACVDIMYTCTPLLVRVAGYLVFIILGGRLDPAKAFVTESLFNILNGPFSYMAFILPDFARASVSLTRLGDFLTAPDIPDDIVTVDHHADSAVLIRDGTFTWDRCADKPTLTSIDLKVARGQLVAVVGVVGAGKSSLLSAILGEMAKLGGQVTVQSSLAYVSQEAWIQNATLRDNILFGSKFESERYRKVIKGCALTDDFQLLIAGDLTEIGEKGVNLSGGQKQRVSLARAVYSGADIHLLDDPLSAVDAHVGKHIFNKVIGHRGMLKNKTRLLVTHGVQWLPFVDNILVLKDGRISECGTYRDLLKHNGPFAQYLKEAFSLDQEANDTEVQMIKQRMFARLSSVSEPDIVDPGEPLEEDVFCSLDEDDDNSSTSCHDEDDEHNKEEDKSGDRNSSRVKHPYVADDNTTGKIIQEVKHPDVVDDKKTGKITQEVKHQDVVDDKKTGKIIQEVKHPDVVDDKKTGKIIQEVKHPDVVDDKKTGKIIQEVKHPDVVDDNKTRKIIQEVKHLDVDDKKTGKIIQEEDMQQGKVSLEIYQAYARAVGLRFIAAFVMIFLLLVACREFKNLWMGKWTEDPLLADTSLINTTSYRSTSRTYVAVYGAAGALEVLARFVFAMFVHHRTYQAANHLHGQLLTNVLRLPMSFFDTTPTGRIISRFSKDMSSVDRLGGCLSGYIRGLSNNLVNLVFVVLFAPQIVVFLLPVSVIYIFMQYIYTASARQLRRWSSKHSSPANALIKESLSGATTVRAFGAQERFACQLAARLETHARFESMATCVSRWFSIRVTILSELVALAAGVLVVWHTETSASMAGLILMYSSSFVHGLSWFVHHSTRTEQELVSLERVMEYAQAPTEADWEIAESSPLAPWPQGGEIVMDDLKLRYRDGLDLVLHGVTCKVHSGEKIGIVGRTGAGKSTLTAALFRLVEASSGQILIDKHHIAGMGLHDLRTKITILPQDPVIFGGSLRMNLDPFNERSAEELWEALKHAHLRAFVSSLPDTLDYDCGEAGKNLSGGQRQLVCLARTLLHKTKVLVLDEATAAVDMETDDLIQKTICREFKDCTVLTIAHRLNTIMGYDRVLVLDGGQVREFDTPKKLLADPSSLFYSLAKDATQIS